MPDLPVEIRCPKNSVKQFAQIVDGVIEIACTDCRNKARRDNPRVLLVLHRYTPAGVFIDSVTLTPVSR